MYSKALINTYSKNFYVTLANAPESFEAVYRIRYQVYCQEFHFEKEEDCAGQREQDSYDQQSLHCLLIHKPTDTAIGCIRLILPDPSNPSLLFPFERFCRHSLDPLKVDLDRLGRGRFGEFSRLAVIGQFRHRRYQCISPANFQSIPRIGRSSYPLVLISLILAGLALFEISELDYAFAMMEPQLAHGLNKYGIPLLQVGDTVDYHGFRGPFLLPKSKIARHLMPELQALLEVIGDEMTPIPLLHIA